MKIIKITCCDECPYCEFYNYYEGIGDDVTVCNKSEAEIQDSDFVPDFCELLDE